MVDGDDSGSVDDASSRHNGHHGPHNGSSDNGVVDQRGGHDVLDNGSVDHVAAGIGHGVGDHRGGHHMVGHNGRAHDGDSGSGGSSGHSQKASEGNLNWRNRGGSVGVTLLILGDPSVTHQLEHDDGWFVVVSRWRCDH